MQTLQSPPERFVVRDPRSRPTTALKESPPTGPFSDEEWARLHQDDRRLASVLGAMGLSILSLALIVYGTIALLAAFGRL